MRGGWGEPLFDKSILIHSNVKALESIMTMILTSCPLSHLILILSLCVLTPSYSLSLLHSPSFFLSSKRLIISK